eukprot:Ihof_evm1s636 gene=Ihof_evmTU1s636
MHLLLGVRGVLDSLEAPILIVDLEGKIYEYNSALTALLGHTRHNAMALSLPELSFQTFIQLNAFHSHMLSQSNTSASYTALWTRANGSKKTFHARICMIESPPDFSNGSTPNPNIYFTITLSIMTNAQSPSSMEMVDWRGSPRCLRDVQKHQEAIFNSVPDAVIVATDNATILMVNKSTVFMFGYSQSEIVGMQLSDLLPANSFHHAELKRVIRNLPLAKDQMMYNGRTIMGVRKDGSEFNITVSIKEMADNCWGEEECQPREIVVVIRDVTERMETIQELKQAHKTSLDTATTLSAIFDKALDGIVLLDHQDRITRVNIAAEFLFGYREVDIIGKELSAIIPAYKNTYPFNTMTKGLGATCTRKLTGKQKDGSTFHLSLSLSDITGPNQDKQFVGFIRDLTHMETLILELNSKSQDIEMLNQQRHGAMLVDTPVTSQSMPELIAKLKRHEAIFDSVPDGVIIATDESVILMINQSTVHLFGYSQTEIVGMLLSDLLPANSSHKAEFQRLIGADPVGVSQIMYNGRPMTGRRKDGGEFHIIVSVKEVIMKKDHIPNNRPQTREVCLLIHDMTERMKTIDALRLAHKTSLDVANTLTSVFDNAPDGIVLISDSNRITRFNAAAETLFGYREVEVIGREVTYLMPSYVGARADGLGTVSTRKLIGKRKDGSTIHLLLTLSEVMLTNKQTWFVGFLRDLTDMDSLIQKLYAKSNNLEVSPNNTMVGPMSPLQEQSREHSSRSSFSEGTHGSLCSPNPCSLGVISPEDSYFHKRHPLDPLDMDLIVPPVIKRSRLDSLASLSPSASSLSTPPSALSQLSYGPERGSVGGVHSSGHSSSHLPRDLPREYLAKELEDIGLEGDAIMDSVEKAVQSLMRLGLPNKAGTDGRKRHLLDLPSLVLSQICVHLDQHSLLQLRATCTELADLLKKLSLDWVMQSRPVNRRVIALAKGFPRLYSLRLTADTANLECLRALEPLQNLHKLYMSFCHLHDTDLLSIGYLKALQVLDLSNNPLTGQALRHLSGLTGLVSLNLTRCSLDDDGLVHLGSLVNLETINLEGCTITNNGLAHLHGLTNLVHLVLADTNITGEGLDVLSSFPRLKCLNLSGGIIDDNNAHHVAKLTNLEALICNVSHLLGDEGVRRLTVLKGLKSLDLTDCSFTDKAATYLATLPNLRHLVLSVE